MQTPTLKKIDDILATMPPNSIVNGKFVVQSLKNIQPKSVAYDVVGSLSKKVNKKIPPTLKNKRKSGHKR
jgi:hypothetical protein